MTSPFRCDDKVTIEAPPTIDPATGLPGTAWTVVASRIWANVQDVLPSRAESSDNGLRIGVQRSRLRIRNNSAVTAAMRVTLHNKGERVMQIVAGPALLDDRAHVEFMLEGYSTNG